ncbi:hypothetical protein MAA8898_03716 [Maliponia aquimaris]|uniref:Thioredoxin-like fold domain-containing protein n=1 Tax=Maliponia aquimaris TaxID=1673631 RepID=A0A238KZK8_9RHOB|nr:hypothetical protein [Maliponia aquimaris]SMX47642.1 hypothetical protein MAA8898_03716 [Maliponia aquimaris]
MRSVKFFLAAGIGLVFSAATALASDLRLIMVEQPGCAYCAAWDDQIAPAYPHTAEGRFAPLVRADLHMGPPEGVTYARRVSFTPTFILVEDGREIARMEGYVGEDFFWPVYAKLLAQHTAFEPTDGQ